MYVDARLHIASATPSERVPAGECSTQQVYEVANGLEIGRLNVVYEFSGRVLLVCRLSVHLLLHILCMSLGSVSKLARRPGYI